MSVSLLSVAKQAGVAPSTVSKVLNGKPVWGSQATRDSVFAAAKALGYSPNRIARGLRRGKHNVIGLVMPSLMNPFYSELCWHLQQAFQSAGYELLIDDASFGGWDELRSIQSLSQRGVDGLVIFGSVALESMIDLSKQMPVAVVGKAPASCPIDSVDVDRRKAFLEAVLLLKDAGHQRIAFFPTVWAGMNLRSWHTYAADLFKQAGLPFDPSFVVATQDNADAGHESFTQFWKKNPRQRPTAAVVTCDLTAYGVMRAAIDLGLRIPQDLSVISGDDNFCSRLLPIALTSVSQPIGRLAKELARCLLNRLDHPGAGNEDSPIHIVLEATLKTRESHGPPPRKSA